MRSTITLEPEVQRLVEEAMRQRKASFNETVNVAIRRGLGQPRRAGSAVVVPVLRLGLLPSVDPMRLNAALDDALAEDAAEALRRSDR